MSARAVNAVIDTNADADSIESFHDNPLSVTTATGNALTLNKAPTANPYNLSHGYNLRIFDYLSEYKEQSADFQRALFPGLYPFVWSVLCFDGL